MVHSPTAHFLFQVILLYSDFSFLAEIPPLKPVNRITTLEIADSELSSSSLISGSTMSGGDFDQRIEAPPQCSPRLSLFYQLDTSARYVHHDAELYWDLLTTTALNDYNKIYEATRDHFTGYVNCQWFLISLFAIIHYGNKLTNSIQTSH
jgi:hypothetical protein